MKGYAYMNTAISYILPLHNIPTLTFYMLCIQIFINIVSTFSFDSWLLIPILLF